MTFKELLLQVRQTIQEAVEHQDFPMEILLKHLNMKASETDLPLFDVMILLENIHDKKYIRNIHPNIVFSFLRTETIIEGNVGYNSILYQKSTIKRIITHLTYLLDQVLRDINISISSVEILSKKEKQQLLYDFNHTKTSAPQNKTIHQLFEEQVRQKPDHIALVGQTQFPNEEGTRGLAPLPGLQFLTYNELNRKSNQLARELRIKGVTPNTSVGVIMEPSIEMIIGILGILKAGAAYLPINPHYPRKRILSILEDTRCSILLINETVRKYLNFTSLENIKEVQVAPLLTHPQKQIRNLDELPLPDRTLINYEKYHQRIGIAMVKHSVSLQATRGCPYNCAYCHKIWPKTHVFRSADNIFSEISQLHSAGVKRFVFIDDIFNLKKQNAAKLL
jgi:non-ribosomal peptide synthetase component F